MDKESGELFKAILLAHLILFLHLLLIACLGFLVIFFYGISQYMLWIFLGASILLAVCGFLFYRRIRTRGSQTFKDIQRSTIWGGRSFEVRILGGLASLKFGRPANSLPIENTAAETYDPGHQLEDPETIRIRELTGLANMLEKNLITFEEFSRVKHQILKSRRPIT
jgi:hypothetical protein